MTDQPEPGWQVAERPETVAAASPLVCKAVLNHGNHPQSLRSEAVTATQKHSTYLPKTNPIYLF